MTLLQINMEPPSYNFLWNPAFGGARFGFQVPLQESIRFLQRRSHTWPKRHRKRPRQRYVEGCGLAKVLSYLHGVCSTQLSVFEGTHFGQPERHHTLGAPYFTHAKLGQAELNSNGTVVQCSEPQGLRAGSLQ